MKKQVLNKVRQLVAWGVLLGVVMTCGLCAAGMVVAADAKLARWSDTDTQYLVAYIIGAGCVVVLGFVAVVLNRIFEWSLENL